MKVLVISNSSRSIVCSARKAGYTVYALDTFGDVDMFKCAEKAEILENVNEKRIYELAHSFGDVDAVITGSGFEKLKFKNMLNNKLTVMEEVNDKLKIAKKFASMAIPHPETASLNNASGLKFPLMIKPKLGSGGMRNVIIKNEEELAFFKERCDANEFIAQEFVKGVPCSASLISTGDDAVAVALNEQLIGIPWLTRLLFAYCGNITPFHTKFNNEMIKYAKQIAFEFKLFGSNGVDFILNERGAVVLEVNPRFQGSLDTVEASTGINIFDSHVKSFASELPKSSKTLCYAVKGILYADHAVVINQHLSNRLIQCMALGQASDIPQQGRIIQADEPVTTLLETGRTRQIALGKIEKSVRYIKVMTEA